VARELGVGWATVWRTVVDKGTPVVDDPGRLDGVEGLGVDETAFLAATATSATTYVTGIVDITRGRPPRLLDVVRGRSGRVYAEWIAERESGWREGIRFAALDPFRGYATALRTALPDAVRVLDCFHVVRLGFACVDEVRRRVQQETCTVAATATTRSTGSGECCAVGPTGCLRTPAAGSRPDSPSATPTARSPSPGGSLRTSAPSTGSPRSRAPAATSTDC
jgi:hypothetical protein